MKVGGCSGHAEMLTAYNYDSVCTAIDTELYKLITFEMLAEAGVHVFVNTLLTGAIMEGQRVAGAIVESGRTADVVERPRTDYARLLVAAAPEPPG